MLSYRIAMPRPKDHLFHVELRVKDPGERLVLAMPVWAPGSYLVREFSRNVRELSASDSRGRALATRKVAKNRWAVQSKDAREVVVRYTVYANELSVRTSHLDASHGYFNGTSVFLFPVGRTEEPCRLRVQAPRGWRTSIALPRRGGGFLARDYHQLVDSPCEVGLHRVVRFRVRGVPHELAVWGRGNESLPHLARDVARVVEANARVFGGLPYERYLFLLHLVDKGAGGLEHEDACSLLVDRHAFAPRKRYEDVLDLVAHEHFHAWNVKRLRPLAAYDYERENYTTQLWQYEGVTTYYAAQAILRAGLRSEEDHRKLLAERIGRFDATPGRRRQSLDESSFDAWIKFYRPDEDSPNSGVSYYQKGSLVALLLDLEIRRRTRGRRSLDDALRLLWRTFGKRRIATSEDDFWRAAQEVAGGSLEAFRRRYVRRTDELDWSVLSTVGLRLSKGDGKPPPRPEWRPRRDGRWPADPARAARPRAWLGLRLREGTKTTVENVFDGSPAQEAGVAPGDELVALDGFRVVSLEERIAERFPGDRVELTVFRRDELLGLPVVLATAPPAAYEIVPVASARTRARRSFRDWSSVPFPAKDK
ncbi:MAG TPA: PDZ domain-containing protein [Candidatus Thermoplasmatota archaeon]|nr:PDZ domain-containing protein [Candidatus Thermoplasmatota archaeon]